LNFIRTHIKYSLTIVGNGDVKAIEYYIEKNNIDRRRIHLVGQVDYSNLGEIIKNHSIGYAMGTSIIEICKYGLPSIMALSTPKHVPFKRNICGGLYADCVKGNVGDNLFAGESEDNQLLIDEVMNQLENSFEQSAQRCYDYIKKDYSFSKNIKDYFSIIENSTRTDFSDIQIPPVSPFRRLIHSISKK
jgi:hypothetical protein